MPHNEIKLELVNLSLLSAQVGGGGTRVWLSLDTMTPIIKLLL